MNRPGGEQNTLAEPGKPNRLRPPRQLQGPATGGIFTEPGQGRRRQTESSTLFEGKLLSGHHRLVHQAASGMDKDCQPLYIIALELPVVVVRDVGTPLTFKYLPVTGQGQASKMQSLTCQLTTLLGPLPCRQFVSFAGWIYC